MIESSEMSCPPCGSGSSQSSLVQKELASSNPTRSGAHTEKRSVSGYVPQLDGLRGIAVVAVLMGHLQPRFPALHFESVAQYNFAGVDLFFVISGFLITGILLDSVGSAHYFRNFYVRRVLRIWPLYFALLAFVFVLLPLIVPEERGRIFALCHPWQSYLVFAQNFFVRKFGIMPLFVTWSLAVEEQFYLVWPLVILSLPRRVLPAFLISVALLLPVVRGLAQMGGASPETLYTCTIFRLDSICAGALLAVWVRSRRFSRIGSTRMLMGITAVGFVGCFITLSWLWALPVCANLRYSAVAIFFFGLVGWALVTEPRSLFCRCLSASWLRYAGKICFGLYLLHTIVFDVLSPKRLSFLGNGWAGSLAGLIINFAAAVLVASCSWRFFESPILGLKHRFEYGRRVVSSEGSVEAIAAQEVCSAGD
ncbi:MAG: acyltransferase [Terriglobales bacterium]|jgi:peptidoglycan/LPS O-acetylase OafA/YrhL